MISLIHYMRIVGVCRRQEDGRGVGRSVPRYVLGRSLHCIQCVQCHVRMSSLCQSLEVTHTYMYM